VLSLLSLLTAELEIVSMLVLWRGVVSALVLDSAVVDGVSKVLDADEVTVEIADRVAVELDSMDAAELVKDVDSELTGVADGGTAVELAISDVDVIVVDGAIVVLCNIDETALVIA